MEYFMGLRISGCLTQSLHGQVHGCATNKSETQYTLYGQQRKIWIHCYDATICIPFPTRKQNSILGSHCIRAFVLQDSVWCCEMDFWFYAVVPEENEEQFPTGGMLTDILGYWEMWKWETLWLSSTYICTFSLSNAEGSHTCMISKSRPT